MKIAILGSAPSSIGLAPFGNPDWKIWACSPGTYAHLSRCDAFFELHRWEPGEIGKAHTQKQWFSPEYVMWMAQRDPAACPVWMYQQVPEIRASRALPIADLTGKYGTYFFTSSISIMLACAIEDILEERANNPGVNIESSIGLWGVDMAANEEYGYQRAGCQHFILLAADLGIKIVVPPESDLLRPMPIYGLVESEHWYIKGTVRTRELQNRLQNAGMAKQQAMLEEAYVNGALDDHKYHMQTWGADREGMGVAPMIQAQMPDVRATVLASVAPSEPSEPIQRPSSFDVNGGELDPVDSLVGTGIAHRLMGDGKPYTGRVRIDPKPPVKRKPAKRRR